MIRYIVRRRYGLGLESPWDLVRVDDQVSPAREESTGYYDTFEAAFFAAPGDAPLAIETQVR